MASIFQQKFDSLRELAAKYNGVMVYGGLSNTSVLFNSRYDAVRFYKACTWHPGFSPSMKQFSTQVFVTFI